MQIEDDLHSGQNKRTQPMTIINLGHIGGGQVEESKQESKQYSKMDDG